MKIKIIFLITNTFLFLHIKACLINENLEGECSKRSDIDMSINFCKNYLTAENICVPFKSVYY